MKRVLLGIIRFYQRGISPLTPASCRFQPSCSEYAREAIQRFGPLRGGGLAVRRVLRCHPFGSHGYDPVPPAKGSALQGTHSAPHGGMTSVPSSEDPR